MSNNRQNKNKKTTKHSDRIKCPMCGHVQKATVRDTMPFYTYIHTCKKCRYIITESDWEEEL